MAYLPLTNNPEELFSVSILETVYNFRQLWNTNYEFWTLDILEADDNPLVYGVKLVTGSYLLEQYPQIPFDLISEADDDPSRDNLDEFILEVFDKEDI
jgi:hypothetical protein